MMAMPIRRTRRALPVPNGDPANASPIKVRSWCKTTRMKAAPASTKTRPAATSSAGGRTVSCPPACTIDARLLVPVTAYVPCRMNATGKSTLGCAPRATSATRNATARTEPTSTTYQATSRACLRRRARLDAQRREVITSPVSTSGGTRCLSNNDNLRFLASGQRCRAQSPREAPPLCGFRGFSYTHLGSFRTPVSGYSYTPEREAGRSAGVR